MEKLLTSSILMDSSSDIVLSPGGFLICTIASLVLGLAIAVVFMYKNVYSRDFVITLILLPAIVQMIIMIVNGNLGTGVAVAGAFSLIRFRSTPGTAREIVNLFMSMAVGLATGMGYVGYAVMFVIILSLVNTGLTISHFGEQTAKTKLLKITIPESMNYTNLFEDIFEQYTLRHELVKVKTSNMGSLYKLEFTLDLKSGADEKEMIDALRCRNGNLEIALGYAATDNEKK